MSRVAGRRGEEEEGGGGGSSGHGAMTARIFVEILRIELLLSLSEITHSLLRRGGREKPW
jgi:hypothetical protein